MRLGPIYSIPSWTTLHSFFFNSLRLYHCNSHSFTLSSAVLGLFSLSVSSNVVIHLSEMITTLLVLLAVTAVSADSLPTTNDLPSPPANVVPSAPAPFRNTALWQQAVTIDAANAAKNITGVTNQYFYSAVAWWQSMENSSNSFQPGLSNPADAGPYMSQLLQFIQCYPTRFDQAQASDPEDTPSKQLLDVVYLFTDQVFTL